MPYNATKIRIKFDKKKTFNRKSIKYLQKFIFQESVKLPGTVILEMKDGAYEPIGAEDVLEM